MHVDHNHSQCFIPSEWTATKAYHHRGYTSHKFQNHKSYKDKKTLKWGMKRPWSCWWSALWHCLRPLVMFHPFLHRISLRHCHLHHGYWPASSFSDLFPCRYSAPLVLSSLRVVIKGRVFSLKSLFIVPSWFIPLLEAAYVGGCLAGLSIAY